MASGSVDGQAGSMPEISLELIVDAPADAVWDVVGRRFDRIGEWATAVPSSAAISLPAADAAEGPSIWSCGAATAVAAPVAGRVCQTGVRFAPQVQETLVLYDEAERTLTYVASGMPAFVTIARNTWSVSSLGAHRTLVSVRAVIETRGLLGLLGRWAMLAQVRRTSRHLAEDLRHYLEHGTPSPRKQLQLRRRTRAVSRRRSR
jgi:hypothetical protein